MSPPYITAPADVAEPAWVEVEPGRLWLTREPLQDGRTSLYARLTYAGALDACAAVGGTLATGDDIERLHADAAAGLALELPPVTLPTVAMVRAAGYTGPLGGSGWDAAAQTLRTAEMSGEGWARVHDDAVGAHLRALGWDGVQRVANAGKHWIAGAPSGRAWLFGWWSGGRWIEPRPRAQGQHNRFHTDYGSTTLARRTTPPPLGRLSLPSITPSLDVLRRGDWGADVVALQRALNAAGAAPLLTLDGDFGPRTLLALFAFQSTAGLSVDGVAGPLTWAALRAHDAAAAPTPPPTHPTLLDLDALEMIPAKRFTPADRKTVKWLVLHTIESNCAPGIARTVAQTFAGASSPEASAHYLVDPGTTLQGVALRDVAWAAPGANREGIQIEQAGWARFTPAEWSAPAPQAMLERVAHLLAALCRRYGLPVAFVDAAGLRRGERGITQHVEASKAFKLSNHYDPGPHYPMDAVLARVRTLLGA